MTRTSSQHSELKRLLRELSERAYREALSRELRSLFVIFEAWQSGDKSPFDVSDAIHAFHHGPNRDLYLFYTEAPRELVVARAIAEGLLPETSVPETVQTHLAAAIAREREGLNHLAQNT